MKNINKRIFAFLLASVMTIQSVPLNAITVYAQEAASASASTEQEKKAAPAPAEGSSAKAPAASSEEKPSAPAQSAPTAAVPETPAAAVPTDSKPAASAPSDSTPDTSASTVVTDAKPDAGASAGSATEESTPSDGTVPADQSGQTPGTGSDASDSDSAAQPGDAETSGKTENDAAVMNTLEVSAIAALGAEDSADAALNNDLLINGKSARNDKNLTISYGQYMSLSVEGLNGVVDYYIRSAGSDWSQFYSCACNFEPGKTYELSYTYKGLNGDERHDGPEDFSFTVEKAAIAAPTGLTWHDDHVSWTAPGTTKEGASLPPDVVSGYTIRLYKDGTSPITLKSDDTRYNNIKNYVTNGGQGNYTFTVQANLKSDYSDHYKDSFESAHSTILAVPEVKAEPRIGIETITSSPQLPQIMIPGETVIELTAEMKKGFEFRSWSGDGIIFSEPGKFTTTAEASSSNSGGIITIFANAEDITAPTVDSYTAEDFQLKGTASDNDAIAAYAFSTTANAQNVTDWTDASAQTSFTFTPAATGSYYFHVKDAAGKTDTSAEAIPVTAVTFHDYYNDSRKEEKTAYIVGDCAVSMPQTTRSAWVFEGWYQNADCTGEPVTGALSDHSDAGYELYAKWEKAQLPALSVVSSDPPADEASEKLVDRVYNGQSSTLSVTKVNAADEINGTLSYVWKKDGIAVGSDSGRLSVTNFADSGTYSVTVSLMDADGVAVDTWTSQDLAVAIDKAPLTLKPTDATTIYQLPNLPAFGVEAVEPTQLFAPDAITVDGSQLSGAVSGTISTDYRVDDPVGSYTITLNGITSDNYDVTPQHGILGVLPKTGTLTVSLSEGPYIYDGQPKEPAVTVSMDNFVLDDTNYDVAYSENNINAGEKVTVTVTMKGNFGGIQFATFTIERADYTPVLEISKDNWLYGDSVNAGQLSVAPNPGNAEPVFCYAPKGTAEYTTTPPTDAGTYVVYAQLPETTNYNSAQTETVEFTINKRSIVLTAASWEFTYDGMAHSKPEYTQTGDGFPAGTGEGFSFVTVDGEVTDVTQEATPNNFITYKLNASAKEGNYDIDLQPGTLTVVPQELPKPLDPVWTAGKASWKPVSKKDLEVEYTLQLFASEDGSEYTLISGGEEDPVTTTEKSYDFSNAIRSHAAEHENCSYYFTVQAVPAGGDAVGYYSASPVTEKSAAQHTATVQVVKGDKIDSASISVGSVSGASAIVINGETATVAAAAVTGSQFCYDKADAARTFAYEAEDGLTVTNVTAGESNYSGKVRLSVTQSGETKTITFYANNADPVITAVSADYTGEAGTNNIAPKSVTLSLTAEDTAGIDAYAIKQGSTAPDEEGWTSIEKASSVTVSETVTEPGEYYFFVKDTDGVIVRSEETIVVSQVSFAHGSNAAGDMASILKVPNKPVRLPDAVGDDGFTPDDGYIFQNWRGTSGIYANESMYDGSGEPLTAYWTQDQYEYTVNYYLMDVNGGYSATPDIQKEHLKAAHDTPKSADMPSLMLAMEGFELDNTQGKNVPITVSKDGRNVLDIYYARKQYNLKVAYTKVDGTSFSKTDKVYYGASLAAYLTKPEETGFTFVGWTFGDSGAEPAAMPAKNVTATGYFLADTVTYHVRYYLQDLDENQPANTYTRMPGRDDQDLYAVHGAEIELSADELTVEGYTYAGATFADAAPGDTVTAPSYVDSIAAADGRYVCAYFKRNTYRLNFNVWVGQIGAGEPAYSSFADVPYGASLPEIESAFPEEGWRSDVEAQNPEYQLSDIIGWSTDAETMPAGDVTVTRQYIPNVLVSYQVKLRLEKADGNYDEKTFNFYSSVGSTVSVGPDGSGATVELDTFASAVDFFNYYEAANAKNADGYYASGTVTDPQSEEGTLELTVTLDRKKATAVINYYADGTKFAEVRKSAKWGTNYNYEPLAFFYGDANGNFIEKVDSVNVTGTVQNFWQNYYVVSYTSHYSLNYGDAYPGTEFDSVESLSGNYAYPMGYNSLNGGNAFTTVNVYYTLPPVEKDASYHVQVVYKKSGLEGYTNDNSEYELIYTINNRDYKVYLANEAEFYTDAELASTYIPKYPGLGRIQHKVKDDQGKEQTWKRYNDYRAKDPRYTYVRLGSNECFLDENAGILYIADRQNRFYVGHLATYSFALNGNEDQPGSQMVVDFRSDYNNTAHERSAVVNNRTYTSGTKKDTGNGKLIITFRNVDKKTLYYVLNGNRCISHKYSENTDVTEFSCEHNIAVPRTGYKIVWYEDETYTKPAVSIKMDGDKYVYGRYERDVITNYAYAYYQPADTDEYITAVTDDLTEQKISRSVNLTDDNGRVITVTVEDVTYRKDGQIVMIRRAVPSLACSDVSVAAADFGTIPTGMYYDNANPGNVLNSWCQDASVTLHVYFARRIYTLTLDSDIDGENPQVSQLRVGQTISAPHAENNGYTFAGWNWYKMPEKEEISTALSVMPACDVLAVAQWQPKTLDPDEGGGIFHYFQNPDLTYSKEAVQNLRDTAADEDAEYTPVKVLWNGTEIEDARLYSGTNGGIVFNADGSTYYVVSLPTPEEDGAYDIHPEKLAAIFQPITVKTEDTLTVEDYEQSVEFYDFGSAVQQTEDSINTPVDGELVNEYGQVLEYFYSLQSFDVTVNTVVLPPEGSTDCGNGTLTVLGAGTYRYGESAHMAVTVPAGYTFVGWFDGSGNALDYDAEHNFYDFTVEGTTQLTAKMQAIAVTQPALELNGSDTVSYGDPATFTAKADFGDSLDHASYVKQYVWYLDDQVQASTSASFTIPDDLDVGEHTVKCIVIAARKDSGVEITVGPAEKTFTVEPKQIVASAENVSAVYDKKTHSITVKVDELTSDDYIIYYSLKDELTAENYKTAGSTTNPALENVNHVGTDNVPYTVYYYVEAKSTNYRDASGSAQVEITPVRLTLSSGSKKYSKIYDGSPVVTGGITEEGSDLYKLVQGEDIYIIGGLLPGDTMDTYIISCDAEFNSAHTADASSIEMSNVMLANRQTGEITYNYDFDNTVHVYLTGYIEKKTIDLVWSGNRLDYTGTQQAPTAALPDGLPEVDAQNLTVTVSGAQTNTGNYNAVAVLGTQNDSVTKPGDYALRNGKYGYSIVGRKLVVAMHDAEVTYDGEEHTLEDAYLLEGTLVEGLGHSFTAAASAKYTNAKDYNIAPDKALVVVRDAYGMDVTDNYAVEVQDEGVLTIHPQPIIVTNIAAKSKDYDGTTVAELILTNAVLGGKVEGDDLRLDAAKITGTFDSPEAGKHTVNITYAEGALTGAAAGNYVLDRESQATTDGVINARTITVKIDDTPIVYGQPNPTFTPIYSNYVGETLPEITGSITCKVAQPGQEPAAYDGSSDFPVGTYYIYPDVTGISAPNYTFAADNGGVLNVTKRLVKVTAAPEAELVKEYDGTLAVSKETGLASGEDYIFTGIDDLVSGIVNNDSVFLSSYEAVYVNKNAGNPDVSVTGAVLNNANYRLDNTSFHIPGWIDKAALTVTASAERITYGDAKPKFALTYDGFVVVDGVAENEQSLREKNELTGNVAFSCDYDTSDSDNRHAGDYPITPSGKTGANPEGLSATNYEIQYIPGTLTVDKATITIQAKIVVPGGEPVTLKSFTYGTDSLPNFTYTAEGFMYGEENSNLIDGKAKYAHTIQTAVPDGKDTPVISSPKGDYPVKPTLDGQTVLQNYEFAYKPAVIKIVQLGLTVKGIDTVSKVYDGNYNVLESQWDFKSINYQGLLSFDETVITNAALHSPLSGSNPTGSPILRIEDAVYSINRTDGKARADVGDDLPITFKVEFGEYLAARYYENENQDNGTAAITARPLLIRPNNQTVDYGMDAPEYTVSFLPVPAEGTENEYQPDTGLVPGENPTEAVDATCEYTIEKGSVSGVTTYDIVPTELGTVEPTSVLRNYSLRYANGTLTVNGRQLAPPVPGWIDDNPGVVQWAAVSGIGDVAVAGYSLQLKKDGNNVGAPIRVDATEAQQYQYDYLETIRNNGAGAYTVSVTAVASKDKNTDNVNVADSAPGTTGDLYAAAVSFVFAQDSITQAGKGSPITINNGENGASYVMIEGEKNIPIFAALKNDTGYTVDSVTAANSSGAVSALVVTESDVTGPRASYASAVSLGTEYNSASPITVTLKLAAVSAEAKAIIRPVDGSSKETVYGYSASTAPHFEVIVSHDEEYKDYTYTYLWKLKESKASTPCGTEREWTLPTGKNANVDETYYLVGCQVTATRVDNGKSCTVNIDFSKVEGNVSNLIIHRAEFTSGVEIENWTYGDARKEPQLKDPSKTAAEHPSINTPEYSYAPADASRDDSSAWKTEVPTDAGDYQVRAYIKESTNYNAFTTDPYPFTIVKAKLDEPAPALTKTADSFAVITYPEVTGFKENNSETGESKVTVQYEINLYKGDDLVAGFPQTVAERQLDIAPYLTAPGQYTVKVQAIAVNDPAEKDNCDNSEIAELPINVGAVITATNASKMYDGRPETLTVSYSGGGSVGPCTWYHNGKQVPGQSGTALQVKNVADSGSYTCVMMVNGTAVIAPAITVSITKRSVTLTSASPTKTYDGTPLTNKDNEDNERALTVSGDGFADNEGMTPGGFTGSQWKVGDCDNVFTFTLNDNTDAGNYTITRVVGKLTVIARTAPIEITAKTDSKLYDGTALTYEGEHTYGDDGDESFTFSGDTLQSGDVLTAVLSGTITHVAYSEGEVTGVENKVVSWKIMHGTEDVTEYYSFGTHQSGTLTINPREVTLTSATLRKTYDGTPLTNRYPDPEKDADIVVTGDGFAENEGVTCNFTGSQLVKGSTSNAFTYTLQGTAGDYKITEVAGTLTVDAITTPIIITAASDEKTYDGTPLTNSGFTKTENVLLEGDVLTAVVEGSITDVAYDTEDQEKAVGAANVVKSHRVMRGEDDVTGCYTFGDYASGTLTVKPRRITLTSADVEKFYDGTELTNVDPITGEPNKVTDTWDDAPADAAAKPGFVGEEGAEYKFTGHQMEVGHSDNTFEYTLKDNTKSGNYIITTAAGTLNVKKRLTITIKAASEERDYDGTALTNKNFTYTCTGAEQEKDNKLGDGDELVVEVVGTITNYGEVKNQVVSHKVVHTDKATGKKTDVTASYDFAPYQDGKLTINRVKIDLYADDKSKTYGDDDPELTVWAKGMVNNETVKLLKWSISRDEGEDVNAGTPYKIHLSVDDKDQGNYTVTVHDADFVITPLKVDLSWTPDSVTYNGAVHNAVATVSNAVTWDGKKDDVTVSTYSGDKDKVDAGTYETTVAELTGDSAGNYTLTGVQLSHSWKIEPRSLPKSPSSTSVYNDGISVSKPDNVTYNGTTFVPKVTVSDDLTKVGGPEKVTLKKGTDYKITYTGNRNAGTAVITITGIGNYTGKITRTFVINPRPVILEWHPDAFVYNGKEHAVLATISNLVNGDIVRVESTGDRAKDAGEYIAEAQTLAGTNARNYTLLGGQNLTHQWKITPAAITLRADDKTGILGEAIEELTWSVTAGTLYGDDQPGDVKLTVEKTDSVGEHPIKIELSNANPNYEITLEDGTYTITAPAPTTVPATDGTDRANGDPCLWHWLILLTDIVYLAVALLTMKRKQYAPDQLEEFDDDRKSSGRRRWVSLLLLAAILLVLNIVGFCHWELPLTILSAVAVPLALWATHRHKFPAPEAAPVS